MQTKLAEFLEKMRAENIRHAKQVINQTNAQLVSLKSSLVQRKVSPYMLHLYFSMMRRLETYSKDIGQPIRFDKYHDDLVDHTVYYFKKPAKLP